MKSVARNIRMTSYDDLLQPTQLEDSGEKVVLLPLSKLHKPRIHPFKVCDDESMQEMVDSILRYGVLTPGIARLLPDGEYELIAGNRRKRASELAGTDTLPVIIRELDDDAATILMVDSNIQRENLLPSEKAFAYKLKLEAMKRQGQRTDLTLSPVATKLDTAALIGEQNGESRDQVFRYIRLTNLIPGLLDLVDEKKIAFQPGVDLSYLPQNEQEILFNIIDHEMIYPSAKQVDRLLHYSKEGKLTEESITVILNEEKPIDHKVTLDGKWVLSRFPESMTPKEVKERIEKALDLLERTERRRQQDYTR